MFVISVGDTLTASHVCSCVRDGCSGKLWNKCPNCCAMFAVWTLKDLSGNKFGQVILTPSNIGIYSCTTAPQGFQTLLHLVVVAAES